MNINESQTAKGYTPAALVPAAFGRKRTIDGIVIHHWGVTGQRHDDVVKFFVTGPGATSAHFVVSAGRVDCLVSPADAAWHSGDAVGNATTIGIECRPEATDADYATVAELVAYLRGQYGPLPLSPHRQWSSTACPGVWDLTRINQLASTITPQGTITPQEDELSQAQYETLLAEIKASRTVDQQIEDVTRAMIEKVAGSVWAYTNPTLGGGDAYQILRDAVANTNKLAADVAKVAAKAATGGATEAQITEAVKKAISESIVTVDVTVGGAK